MKNFYDFILLEKKRFKLNYKQLGDIIGKSGDAMRMAVDRQSLSDLEKREIVKYFAKEQGVNEEKVSETEKQTKNKVPVYEIDAISSIVSSFSDVKETPSFYIDYEPFNDCDAVVTNYGDSMHPEYKNGERLAVKRIQNFDVINWGETYLVITDAEANDLKTVKRVHPHDDNDKMILRAGNPKYAGDTVVNKINVLALFAVKGKVSQNFI